MKTRIISGAVMVAILAAVIYAALYLHIPFILTAFLTLLTAIATFEMFSSTKIVENKILLIIAVVISAAMKILLSLLPTFAWYLAGVYAIFAILFCLFKKESYKKTVFIALVPVLLSFAFNSISVLLNLGLVHLLLILNFSSICDTGAYFVGVTMGKHKLCPKISPKKTVEGAIGGLVASVLVTILITKIFTFPNMWLMVALTPIFCIFGIIGDLSASVIKRRVGIKDYGKLIPGHGGIMDRFDSILLIAPVYMILYLIIW